jgi:NADPH-dependent glutamate synthase beta subunit-like oxidoreductase
MNRDQSRAEALFLPRSYTTTESNKTGSWRYLRPRFEEKTAPCSAACPAGEDIPRIEMLTTQGAFREAWETILMENPFPGVCGRVCFHPCEGACNRRGFDSAVAVHTVERFLADLALRNVFRLDLERLPARKERVAVVGAGPAGLAASYFLARLGYSVTVLEALPEPGGILRWGIPAYRLPPTALRPEIARLEGLGVTIRTDCRIDRAGLEGVARDHDAVFLGCGLGKNRGLGIPGEGEEGVEDGLAFLARVRGGESPQDLKGLSVVVGGGNTAVDVARTAVRLGGRAVIAYRRRRADMPAFDEEVRMALEEGVELLELLAPAGVVRRAGRLLVTFRRMRIEGEDADGRGRIVPDGEAMREIEADRLFTAAGSGAAFDWNLPPREGGGLVTLSHSVLVAPEGQAVRVYGGDVTNDVQMVVTAVASGKQAALALDVLFREGPAAVGQRLAACAVGPGPSLSMEIYTGGPRGLRTRHVVLPEEINTDYFAFEPRITQPRLLVEERSRSFAEIDLRISAGLAMREAGRCFHCGICNGCDNCYLFCPDVSIARGHEGEGRRIDYDYCKGCGLCVVECPRNAMTLEEEP